MQVLRTAVSCLALAAAAAVLSVQLSDHAAAARGCSATMSPVCGLRADGPRTYSNACEARADRARIVHLGDCQPILCSGVAPALALQAGIVPSQPMCGLDPLNHAMVTYPNSCAAEYAHATWLHNGPCRGGRRH